MLLPWEGHVFHFAAPKTTYNKDIELSNDTPVFDTAKAPVSFVRGSLIDEEKLEMLNFRWRTITFEH